jgi:hypothetical protein
VVVRDTTMLMGDHYLKRDRVEGSQAMPASPSGGGFLLCEPCGTHIYSPYLTGKHITPALQRPTG